MKSSANDRLDPAPDAAEGAGTDSGILPAALAIATPIAGADPRTTATTDNRRGLRQVGTQRAIRAVKAQHAADRSAVERLADRLTRLAGSTPFLVTHAFWFVGWIGWNTLARVVGHVPFDPFPFGLLTLVVSLEAIFLTIFVLMAQQRESAIAELREEMTLQVNLRMEEEVTKTLQLVAGLYTRLGHRIGDDAELQDMLRPLDSTSIERMLISQIEESQRGTTRPWWRRRATTE